MKFYKDADLSSVLISLTDDISITEKLLTNEEIKSIYGDRQKLVDGIVSFRAHQSATVGWHKHRWSHTLGLKRWHRSTAGKKAHRQIGRLLATRERPEKVQLGYFGHDDQKSQKTESLLSPLSLEEKYDALVGFSSLRTHLYLERQYINPRLEESVELASLVEYAAPLLLQIEERLLQDDPSHGLALSEEEKELLLRLVDMTELLKCIAEEYHKTYPYVNALYSTYFTERKAQESLSSSSFLTNIFERVFRTLDEG